MMSSLLPAYISVRAVHVDVTRMHSSRMRTGRSLTVCWRLLPRGGGVWSRGGLVPGGSGPRGVPGPGGSGPGGVWSWGVPGPGGCAWSGGVGGVYPSMQTPPRGQTHACKNITLAQLRCCR